MRIRLQFIDFMRWGGKTVAVSVVLVVLSLGLFFGKGLDYGIDFTGGTLLEVAYQQPPNLADLRGKVAALGVGQVQMQEFGDENTLLVRVGRGSGKDEGVKVVSLVRAILEDGGENVEFRRSEFVGPKVGREMINKGITAVLLSLLAILGYIWVRFDGWQFAVAAVLALVHDVVLTIGFFGITGLEFNLAIVAAMLTIAGYSINDTVVVFDRIREMATHRRSGDVDDLLNRALNGTLSRTVVTSLTTLLALLALYFFGGQVLRGFIIAMIWGVAVGTFSSIFFATPLLKVLGFNPTRLS